MRVLVAAASKHGSTHEMGEVIGAELTQAGLTVDVMALEAVTELSDYDAVVLGSGVYVGRWLPEAAEFVRAHAASLGEMPVWLFSSGPLGSPEPMPKGEPEEVSRLVESIGAREHRVFTGRLDREALGLGEKVIVSVVRAPYGDFRDWDGLRDWAASIGHDLHRDRPAAATV
jgi:menaquinone-dependent protoporphyrinogen oxidase